MPTTVTSILANPKRDTNDDLRLNADDLIDGAAVRGIQLVRLSTSNAALVLDGSASTTALSAPTDMVVLKTKAKDTAAATNWAPSTVTTVSYLGAVADISGEKAQYSVIERTGSGATATYKSYVFVEDAGAGTATMIGTVGQTISLSKLLELERAGGVDLNNDNAIGDAVAAVLASPRSDYNGDFKIDDNDVDESGVAPVGKQLVRLASGAAALDYSGATAGTPANDVLVLKTKANATATVSTNWAPSTVAGVTYLGVVDQSDLTDIGFVGKQMVIERTGSGATATYRGFVFVEDVDSEGNNTGTATMTGTVAQTLSLTQVLQLESRDGLDFNGDKTIGDSVASVIGGPRRDTNSDGRITDDDTTEVYAPDGSSTFVQAKGTQLVKLASGATALDWGGTATTGSSAGDVLVLRTKAAATAAATNWLPSTLATVSYLGAVEQYEFNESGDVIKQMVVERTGSGATATYKGYAFVMDVDGNMEPTGTATMIGTVGQTLSLTQVLQLESFGSVDFNGDKTIGDAVASVLASPRGDLNNDDKITSDDGYTVFSDNGTPDNPEDDKEVTVLTKGAQLVRLTSGAVGIDFWGEAVVGSSAGEMPILKVKATATATTSANWLPSTLATVSYLGAVDQSKDVDGILVNQAMVIERTGAATAATATYKGYLFVEDLDVDGYPTGTATMTGTTGQTLSLAQVLKLESQNGVDFNGDNTIGDAVASVLASPRFDMNEDGKITSDDGYTVLSDNGTPDNPEDDTEVTVLSKGTQLVRLASGATALDFSSMATAGSSAMEMPVLKTKANATSTVAANWLPSTLATVSYLGAVDQSEEGENGFVGKTMVIERTGSGATATYKGYLFVEDLDADGMPAGSASMIGTVPQTLSLARVLQLEQEGSIDLNGDTAIGDAVVSVLGGARLDWNNDGRINDDDVFDGEEGAQPALAKGAQLVKLLSGGTAVDLSGTATTGSSAFDMPLLKTKASATATLSTNWLPSTLATVSYLGVVDQSEEGENGFVGKTMVIERTGSGATATYKGYTFTEDLDVDGMPIGSASMVGTAGQTLSLARVLQLEWEGSIDLNGDKAIGDAVASVLGGGRLDTNFDNKITDDDSYTTEDGTQVLAKGIQLVKLVSGVTALDWDGTATTGSPAMDMVVLRSKAAATAAAVNWAPSTLATVSYLGVVDQSTVTETAMLDRKMVVERTGSGATATYKGYMFVTDVDDNGMTGTATMTGTAPQTLSLSQVLALESWGGVDLNGDKTIGDSVLSVLGGSRMDTNGDGSITEDDVMDVDTPDGPGTALAKGIQLVKLASGAAAVDWTGSAKAGSSATDMPVLQVKAAATAAATNWVPTTVATVSFAGAIASDDGQTLSVVERAGTASSSAAKLWQFTVDYKDNGEVAGTATMIGTVAQTLSANQLLSLESQNGVDLNGDGKITLSKWVEGTDEAGKVEGDVGNDVLFGGGGVDTMVGGLGADLFMFTDIDESSSVPRKATDVINDLSVAEDMLVFNLSGPMAMRIKGNYASAASFAKAADRLLDGRVKTVFGTVGNDGYLAVDNDGDGVTHLIQLVGVKQAPSILTPDTLPDGFGF